MAARSGKIVLRMSPELHGHLAALAEAQGVSLNHLLVEYLSGASGFKAETAAKK